MKPLTVLAAQATDALKANIFVGTAVFDIVDAVKERYNFRQIPSNRELLNPAANQLAAFVWGKREFEGRIITVDRLQVQNFSPLATTVSVITRSSTADCDLVLGDLAEFVFSTFQLDCTRVLPRSYQSQIECQLDRPLDERLKVFLPIGDSVTAALKTYGFTASPAFVPTALSWFFDNSKLTNPPTVATAFTIDRRVGVPHEQNKYFSQAPLKTPDHIKVLEQLEFLLADG